MRTIQLREAKATLSALVEEAAHGETAVITRHGKPAPSSSGSMNGTAFATFLPSAGCWLPPPWRKETCRRAT